MMSFLLLPALSATFTIVPEPQGLSGKSDTQPVTVPFQAQKWKLTWSDEFDKPGSPDPSKWGYEEGKVRNQEAQFYTKDRRENARIEKGHLVIEARMDNFKGEKISSASLNTQGKKSFLYGRIEARAKIPTGKGTWPAIWTLGENVTKVGWPKSGEIDILENVGFDPLKVHANIHVDAYNHTKGTGKGNNISVPGLPEKFNLYAIEWYEDRMEFFFNDTRYFVFRNERKTDAEWPFDKPQYLLLNLAIGGAWGGQQGIDEKLFPHKFEIDYVRYYELKK